MGRSLQRLGRRRADRNLGGGGAHVVPGVGVGRGGHVVPGMRVRLAQGILVAGVGVRLCRHLVAGVGVRLRFRLGLRRGRGLIAVLAMRTMVLRDGGRERQCSRRDQQQGAPHDWPPSSGRTVTTRIIPACMW